MIYSQNLLALLPCDARLEERKNRKTRNSETCFAAPAESASCLVAMLIAGPMPLRFEEKTRREKGAQQ